MSIKDWIYRVIGNENDATLVTDDEAEEPVAYHSGDVYIVRNTGDAIGEDAVTGFRGRPPKGSRIIVENTGDAIAKNGGSANSGITYT